MDRASYRFGRFHLNPAARELWTDGRLLRVRPLVFDSIVYLIQHSDRVVGRDELVSAVWGRVDVADVQVRQLIARARQTIGDDAQKQQAIRTVPGGGYRWVMSLQAADVADQAVTSAPADGASPSPAPPPPRMAHEGPPTVRRRRRLAAAAACGLVLAVAAAYLALRRNETPAGATHATVQTVPGAIAVMPLEVSAPDESAWVRLGAMDLVATRLRGAGLPVPPSDNVVAALHAAGEPLDAGRLATLQHTLGAGTLVRGSATRSSDGWKVELSAVAPDGNRHTAEAERQDVVEAATQAADFLLASLGHVPAPSGEKPAGLQELLQRAEAALLANQVDTARRILAEAPEAMRGDAQMRIKLAQVEQRAGRQDEARDALESLLADRSVSLAPALRARALTALGFIALNRNDCEAAERRFDAAVSAFDGALAGLDAGAALSARGAARGCSGRSEEALRDLGAAGPILEAAGNRLGMATLNNHFGVLEHYRRRPAEAVPYLQAAAQTHAAFGAVDGLRADLGLLVIEQSQLLRWPDALASSEQLWTLHERIGDRLMQSSLAGLRARVLIRSGRLAEADALLRSVEAAAADSLDPVAITFHQARAELAWTRGEAQQAQAEAARVMRILPPAQMKDDEDLYTVLLYRRASLALGRPAEADAVATVGPAQAHSPIVLVGLAESAAQAGRAAEAQHLLDEAATRAQQQSVPDTTLRVTQAQVRWLLQQGRRDEALAAAGLLLPWAERDFDCALVQVEAFHAAGQRQGWANALDKARALAGERRIPDRWQVAPGGD
jgi:DNA-binding winged helix-turn-helix (wHTH) protein/tetratricopeptide (TPR) repeat protein